VGRADRGQKVTATEPAQSLLWGMHASVAACQAVQDSGDAGGCRERQGAACDGDRAGSARPGTRP